MMRKAILIYSEISFRSFYSNLDEHTLFRHVSGGQSFLKRNFSTANLSGMER